MGLINTSILTENVQLNVALCLLGHCWIITLLMRVKGVVKGNSGSNHSRKKNVIEL